jgi:hypothetical protein
MAYGHAERNLQAARRLSLEMAQLLPSLPRLGPSRPAGYVISKASSSEIRPTRGN